MATTTPPKPPLPGPTPPSPQPPGEPRPNGARPGAGRWIAVGALGVVVAVIAYLAFSGGGGASYQLLFANASQLVRGDQVQVGGVPVGSVTNITLTHDYKARVTISVESSLVPLHEGTTAQVRVPSLTTVAGRYVALTPGPNNRPALPNGATLPASAAQGTVDLDQLFNLFTPRTREGLKKLFVGSGEQFSEVSAELATSIEYFNPSLASAEKVFEQLTRDQPTFTNFIVQSARAFTTLADHRTQLSSVVSNGDHALQAFAAQQAALQQGVKQLPATLQEGNRAFGRLPATFSALRKLATAAVPDTTTLASFLSRLNELAGKASPVLHELSLALSRPGPNNDLTDVALALPALARELAKGSSTNIRALQESVPLTADFGPYSPDLVGAARSFGTDAGYYDADGHYARAALVFDTFKLGANDTLTPTTAQQGVQGLKLRQLQRCPGAAATPSPGDGSAPFTDNGLLDCNPAEVP